MARWILVALLALAANAFTPAQDEATLKSFFEGRKVVVELDMPATCDGIDLDVFPTGNTQISYGSYSKRLKQFGIALRDGDSVLVTKIKVKKDMIEFQLGGGGYGTFGDDTDTSVHFTPAPKSDRELDLEKQVDKETDAKRRRWLQDQLDDVRWRRERDDDRRRHDAEVAAAVKADRIQELRLQGGSRFNLHYGTKVQPADLTPERVMASLGRLVIFPWVNPPAAESAAPAPAPAPNPVSDDTAARIHKGMTRADVETVMGSPVSMSERTEGSLNLLVCIYERGAERVEAVFYDGILIRYTIASK